MKKKNQGGKVPRWQEFKKAIIQEGKESRKGE